VKVRLHGTRAEVAEATRRLLEVLDVVTVSDPYPDRGASVLVRVYLEVRLETADPAPVDRDTPGRSPDPSPRAGGRGRRRRGEVAGR
jgi:hypothetical protein